MTQGLPLGCQGRKTGESSRYARQSIECKHCTTYGAVKMVTKLPPSDCSDCGVYSHNEVNEGNG